MNKRVDFWLETLAYWLDEIVAAGADREDKVNDYKQVIKEIYDHNKKGLIGKTDGDKIREMANADRKTLDKFKPDVCFDYYVTDAPEWV